MKLKRKINVSFVEYLKETFSFCEIHLGVRVLRQYDALRLIGFN